MNPIRVRVRGIYSTALSKIFIDEGYRVVQPSKIAEDRFNIDDEAEFMPYDIDIFDREDKYGVHILASRGLVDDVRRLLHKYLFDAIINVEPYSVRGIYKGRVEAIDKVRGVAYISIGDGLIGTLKLHNEPLKIGDDVIVQVDKSSVNFGKPILTTRIGLAGEYVVIFRGEGVKISRRLRSKGVVDDDLKPYYDILPEGFGVIFRSSFKSASKDDILNEISNLIRKYEGLQNSVKNSPVWSLLIEGYSLMNVLFPHNSKNVLDDVRRKVTPTINSHHYFKSLGKLQSNIVDRIEEAMKLGVNVESMFSELEHSRRKFIGGIKFLEHVKLNGEIVLLGNIESIKVLDNVLEIVRKVKSSGSYDGLNVARKVGDRILTKIRFGDWYYVSRYYSSDGRFIGAYVNINTPVEVYPGKLRYIDLAVDICIKPNGEFEVLDLELLDNAFKSGIVSERLYEFIHNVIGEVKSSVLSEVLNNLASTKS
jgi:Ribonuclease G/E